MTSGTWLEQLTSEAAVALSDPSAVRSMALACAITIALLVGGRAVTSLLDLVPVNASRAEMVGVALCTALVMVAVIWAGVASRGSSAFTPSAVAMVMAIGLAIAGKLTGRRASEAKLQRRWKLDMRWVAALALLVSGVVSIGLTFGVTMNPSPRDGIQPIPFFDEAFYSVLGRDLARTGMENLYSPSGFARIDGLPAQTWYHWGELWLAAALDGLGVAPMHVRHYVVLPILLAAGAVHTGVIVRVATGLRTVWPLVFGGAGFLFLAPLPLDTSHFGGWSRGMLFGITMYGLAVVIALLLAYRYLTGGTNRKPWQILFEGAVIAALLAAHVVLAGLIAIAIGAVGSWRLLQSREINVHSDTWRVFAAGGALVALTAIWGIETGHGIGTSGLSETVEPFNWSWGVALLVVAVGGFPLWAIALAYRMGATRAVIDLVMAASASTVVGAVVWGARLGDFTSFHAFFGPLAVYTTPAALVALALLVVHVSRRRRTAAVALKAFLAVYLAMGGVTTLLRLQEFGFSPTNSMPTAILEEVARLPEGSAVAYQCGAESELAFWNPRLVSIDAYTGRHVVTLCFQSEIFPVLTGTPVDGKTISPLFRFAPQREIFPAAGVIPSENVVVDWMRRQGIGYIYADENHPNTIVPNAVVIARVDSFSLSRIP